jgi:DNA mismatch repair protein MutL
MDIIQLLPDSVANQIAAGEVIQRPSSVIKELVENAIDAGAKTVKVLVVDAGRTSIQVIDDGCGMSETDARLSFERHATSKIRKADDLFALHTMGFRGEALASIAAVAQVTLQTRRAEDELGTRITLEGSRVTSQEPVACAVGSSFCVENLFFNVPARRKFLKSNTTEMSNINQTFERIVLVYPQISFILYNNGQETMNLPATSLRQRIVDVFGKKINQTLLPLDTATTLCQITGFVGKPESARKKGAKQFFFVNGRYMKHPYFHKAVQQAFERLIASGDQVPYFIYFDVNPEDIDVNIHPVKTEIKFENEQAIWQILMATVRDAVGKFSGVTEIDFDVEGRPDIPVYNPDALFDAKQPTIEIDSSYNPFKCTPSDEPQYLDKPSRASSGSSHGTRGGGIPSSSLGLGDYKPRQTQGWESLYSPTAINIDDTQEDGNIFSSVLNDYEDEQMPLLNRGHEHLQYSGKYIVTQVENGLMFTDQYRADVRILFEYYMHSLATRTSSTQKILFPEVVQFPPSYSPYLSTAIGEMCSLGFEISEEGNGSYSVSGIPAGLDGLDAVTLVNELVSAVVEYGSDVKSEINSFLALQLAERAATPYGEILSQEQMESLIERLLQCENSRYTPDGKTITVVLGEKEIEQRF